MSKMRSTSFALALACTITPTLWAHGGQYRGPGDIVPPNAGGGRGTRPGGTGPGTGLPDGPKTPGPNGPTTPNPGGPSTGGMGPVGAGRTAARTGGSTLEPDLTRWAFWWELNKDPFIRLKDAVHTGGVTSDGADIYLAGKRRDDVVDTLRPTPRVIQQEILPALKRALDGSTDRDIISSCIVAMAKIGEDHPEFRILPLFEARLKEGDQEIRETAALAMGISRMPAALPLLLQLAGDKQEGRAATDRGEVDARTRAFAAYGAGLVAYASSSTDLKRAAFDALADALKNAADRNIKVGAILGIRMIRPNPSVSDKERKLRDDMLATLWSYYNDERGQGDQQIQAHVPTAIASILGRGGDSTGVYKERLAGELREQFGKRNINIYQSAALALGQLCTSGPDDAKYSKLLDEYAGSGRDQQTRYFSIISLARIGGNANRNALLARLATGQDQEKSWAAIALGILAHEARDDRGSPADATIGRALRDVLSNEKNDEVVSAVAVALGLAHYTDAADDLKSLLAKYKQRDELAGYLCIGLALMNDTSSKDVLREIAKTSIRRPDLLKQAAIALGKMGDKQVATDLTELLAAPDRNVAKLSAIASALGFIGDRRSISPLKTMLFDPSITELSRAFAAVALGGIADKEDLPWNSKIAVGVNYRAAVETLTNSVSGILDIL